MKWNILALIGILLGLCLIRGGLDSLLEWRAWFLGVSGLLILFVGVLRLLLSARKIRTGKYDSATGD